MSDTQRDFFISRAGENAAVAIQIAEILRGAGYSTFIQDQDFGNTNFMARMADGFAMVDRGARVIAVLSPHYLKKEYCLAEAQYSADRRSEQPARAADRAARRRLRSRRAFLKGIPFVDLVPLLLNVEGFVRAVRNAVAPRGQVEVVRTPGAQVLHAEIKAVPGFTGPWRSSTPSNRRCGRRAGPHAHQHRGRHQRRSKGWVASASRYWRSNTAGVTVSATTAYGGWRGDARDAARRPDPAGFPLRRRPEGVPERGRRPADALDHVEQTPAEKPWLLVYDNVESPATSRT